MIEVADVFDKMVDRRYDWNLKNKLTHAEVAKLAIECTMELVGNMKYEFIPGSDKRVYWHTVRQIRRLADGKIGGFIESYDNLSQEGDCWVADNAVVFNNAVVCGNAVVQDNAMICGNAKVQDNAIVRDSAVVCDRAVVYDNANIVGAATICEVAAVYGNATVRDQALIGGGASISGNAVVQDEARVYGSALVTDFSFVSEQSEVCEQATVRGNAKVCGKAKLSGYVEVYAEVYGNAVVTGDVTLHSCVSVAGNAVIKSNKDLVWFGGFGTESGTLTAYRDASGEIHLTRGCFAGSVTEFLEKSAAKHHPDIQREYALLIEVAKSRLQC